MAEFSKEELLEIIKIQQTTSRQLETIVSGINGIVERQQRILSNVENGLGERITRSLQAGCVDCRTNVKQMGKDVAWLKILFGVMGFGIIVATIVIEVLKHKY